MEKIAIATSVYKSQNFINEFYQRILNSILELGLDYEFIFVNDGSPDDSASVIEEIARKDSKVSLVNLSRNFGQYPAMFAAMCHACSSSPDYVYISDIDLEEAPENIISFYKTIKDNKDIDVVFGVVKARKGGIIKKYFGRLFFVLLNKFSDYEIPKNQAWARLMSYNYVKSLLEFQEAETLPAGLMYITGYKQQSFLIEKPYKGTTSYSFFKRFNAAVSAITSFSSKPLLYITFLGALTQIISLIFVLYIIISKIIIPDTQAGWSSLIASIWLVGGMIIFCIGVVGIYLAKVFNQVKKRPLYIVKSIINFKKHD